jgi:hypothetical protein
VNIITAKQISEEFCNNVFICLSNNFLYQGQIEYTINKNQRPLCRLLFMAVFTVKKRKPSGNPYICAIPLHKL